MPTFEIITLVMRLRPFSLRGLEQVSRRLPAIAVCCRHGVAAKQRQDRWKSPIVRLRRLGTAATMRHNGPSLCRGA